MFRSPFRWLFFLACAQIFGVHSLAGARDVASRADEYLNAQAKLGSFNGSVLIAKQGQIILRRGYGLANFEHDIPITPETTLRIGSITKQFTATAILYLQERGLLSVNDSIRKYLPDFPAYGNKIKLHHLLTHSSGLREYGGPSERYMKPMMTPRSLTELVARITAGPPVFEPGERFRYSNSGYTLLGIIIEKISGKSYEDFLSETFFQPLQMDRTGYDHSATILKGRASGYRKGSDGLENALYIDMSNPYAAGALYSTVDDLYKWDQALYTERFLKKTSSEMMFHPHIKVRGTISYGYGWMLGPHFGHRAVQHGGAISGFRSRLIRLVNDRAVIIVLSNFEHAPINRISDDLVAILLGQEYEIPKSKN